MDAMDAMAASSLDLPETNAAEQDADAANARVVRRAAVVLAAAGSGAALYFYALEQYPRLAAVLVGLLAVALFTLRRDPPAGRRSPLLVLLLLLNAVVAFLAWGLEAPWTVAITGLVLPLAMLLFRLRPLEYLALLGPLWAVTVGIWLARLDGLWTAPAGLGGLIWPSLAGAVILGLALNRRSAAEKAFLERWRRQVSLDRERQRLRGEIEDARQIQLSMLPRQTPRVDWLEIASASMPASEVGGDYFDYFDSGDGRLTVVVGDVAGHGLASGLLLSGLRSCLFLLQDELTAPAEVMPKLDRMVRHTSGRRMLVTLLCACFDRRRRAVTLASAGHPPPLLRPAGGGAIEELELPAMPLGTRLPVRYRQRTVELTPGDLLVCYTDGLTEMTDRHGEVYGTGRLEQALAGAGDASAREVRSSVLADLSNFKGDARRLDDVTLVVVRVR